MKMIPYLMFQGNAEEAINFYVKNLGASVAFMQRYGDSPMPGADADAAQKIMHASMQIGESILMISDSMKGQTVSQGNNVHLSIDAPDVTKLETLFNNMAAGGKVDMPLQDTFWGARFGMLTDQFGVHWMFNHDYEKKDKA
jgi:PhnB protein